ncbi:MAG TPA: metallophosphoesterase [Candidatus Copromorpha excrementigallinarum]|uniref:Metallophosphoesterase n=1 Tax=Candidatus Allocopromorpha excrementigallinarum TaxID=2840742 RepID=A0A9D1L6J3_9FIRM|nr:metallophosphoesterase [Candidatus Copromorpha excrementigallinarum]
MSIYAIGDTHLSFAEGKEKPMDIFGPRWYQHWKRLEKNWRDMVKEEDTVIVAGDISWALKLEDAKADLDWIDALPGRKVMFKGNHDLWWSGIKRLNAMYENITFIQNDFFLAENIYICGSRGWITPDSDEFSQEDEKVYRREQMRLEASIEKAEAHIKKRISAGETEKGETEIIGVMHYPPVSKPAAFSGFQQIFEDHGIKRVFYGHVHGEEGFRNTIRGKHHGIEYFLISLDFLNGQPFVVKK